MKEKKDKNCKPYQKHDLVSSMDMRINHSLEKKKKKSASSVYS